MFLFLFCFFVVVSEHFLIPLKMACSVCLSVLTHQMKSIFTLVNQMFLMCKFLIIRLCSLSLSLSLFPLVLPHMNLNPKIDFL